jgi:hypothetical protein
MTAYLGNREPRVRTAGFRGTCFQSLPSDCHVKSGRKTSCSAAACSEAEINRMSLLLGTLSDASRLTFGRLELRLVDADLGAIMRAHVERLEPAAAARVHVQTSAVRPHRPLGS